MSWRGANPNNNPTKLRSSSCWTSDENSQLDEIQSEEMICNIENSLENENSETKPNHTPKIGFLGRQFKQTSQNSSEKLEVKSSKLGVILSSYISTNFSFLSQKSLQPFVQDSSELSFSKEDYREFLQLLSNQSTLLKDLESFRIELVFLLGKEVTNEKFKQLIDEVLKNRFTPSLRVFTRDDSIRNYILMNCLEKFIFQKISSFCFGLNDIDRKKDLQIHEKIYSLQFITPAHLDIDPSLLTNETNHPLFEKVKFELSKMNFAKSPRRKLLSIFNSCKYIYSIISSSQPNLSNASPISTEEFLPLMIYAIIQSNPISLFSNLEFVLKYRISSLMTQDSFHYFNLFYSAVLLIENLNLSSLTIDSDDDKSSNSNNNNNNNNNTSPNNDNNDNIDNANNIEDNNNKKIEEINNAKNDSSLPYRYRYYYSNNVENLTEKDMNEILIDYRNLLRKEFANEFQNQSKFCPNCQQKNNTNKNDIKNQNNDNKSNTDDNNETNIKNSEGNSEKIDRKEKRKKRVGMMIKKEELDVNKKEEKENNSALSLSKESSVFQKRKSSIVNESSIAQPKRLSFSSTKSRSMSLSVNIGPNFKKISNDIIDNENDNNNNNNNNNNTVDNVNTASGDVIDFSPLLIKIPKISIKFFPPSLISKVGWVLMKRKSQSPLRQWKPMWMTLVSSDITRKTSFLRIFTNPDDQDVHQVIELDTLLSLYLHPQEVHLPGFCFSVERLENLTTFCVIEEKEQNDWLRAISALVKLSIETVYLK